MLQGLTTVGFLYFPLAILSPMVYNDSMKNKKHTVTYDALQTASQTAKKQNQRIGQLVVNTLLPAHGHTNPEALLELFNCEDKDFWKKATLALDIR